MLSRHDMAVHVRCHGLPCVCSVAEAAVLEWILITLFVAGCCMVLLGTQGQPLADYHNVLLVGGRSLNGSANHLVFTLHTCVCA